MRRVLLLAVGLSCLASGTIRAQPGDTALERDVKATFLFQFSRYVDWPADALPPRDGPFRVCLIAGPAFTQSLDKAIEGEKVDGHVMVREVPDKPAAAKSCQILFVERSEFARAAPFLAAVEHAPVLTVSDAPDFLDQHGHIMLVRDENRIRFDINLAAARQSRITVRSQLLRVARKVRPS